MEDSVLVNEVTSIQSYDDSDCWMQNQQSLLLILRQTWLTPTVRTNWQTAKNICQWLNHSCMRHSEADRISPSASLLSAGTMFNLLKYM